MRIAICGDDGTGKSTLAKELAEHYGCDMGNLAFADGVRQELASKYLQVPVHRWWQKPTPDCIRNLLKGHGDLMRKIYGDDYWVLKLVSHIKAIGACSWTIGDMRFCTEATWAKSQRAVIIYLGDYSQKYGLASCYEIADIYLPARPALTSAISAIDKLSQ